MEQKLNHRIAEIAEKVPGSIGDLLHFQVVECDEEKGDYTLTCKTDKWMTNFAGTLHGGICATILDQAMGFVSYCLKPGDGAAPTIQIEVDYHRPLHPGEDVLVKVHLVSSTRSLMNLTAEAMQLSTPDKIAMSASGIYFYKSAE